MNGKIARSKKKKKKSTESKERLTGGEKKEKRGEREGKHVEGGWALISSPAQILAAKHRAQAAQHAGKTNDREPFMEAICANPRPIYLMQPACPVVTL